MKEMYDIIIIGAGAVGCAIARELSRYRLRIAVLEKECDVAAGTSGRNSAVVHAGFNNRPGTLMARMCVEGNQGFEALCRELDVPYKKTGKLVVGYDEEDREALKKLIRQGEENGCIGLRLIEKDEVDMMAPRVGGICAMYSPETAIFDPFLYTLSLAENAQKNGAEFYFEEEVSEVMRGDPGISGARTCQTISEENSVSGIGKNISEEDTDPGTSRTLAEEFSLKTAKGHIFRSRIVINSAGLGSAKVASLAGIDKYRLYPCRGEYLILDKKAGAYLDMPVYPVPRPGIGGLGVHLTPTVHGNMIIGPSAEYLDDGEDYATTKEVMDRLLTEARQLLPILTKGDIIGTYAGIRSKQTSPQSGGYADFTICEEEELPGWINLIGIESPGMTASMPIARYAAGIVGRRIPLKPDPYFDPYHKNILRFAQLSPERQAELIKEDPEYGEIVCRCNQVTKKEIRQAIENPLGVRSVSAIKYRAWATTGRCQGGYCMTRIASMLENEYGLKPEEITYRGSGSEMFTGHVKS